MQKSELSKNYLLMVINLDYTFDNNGLLKFQMHNWLSGFEYTFLLRHYRAYMHFYPSQIQMGIKSHPPKIYDNPKSGQIYLIQGWHLREFGFPRD